MEELKARNAEVNFTLVTAVHTFIGSNIAVFLNQAAEATARLFDARTFC